VPPKDLPAIATTFVDQADTFGMKTPTNKAPPIGITPIPPSPRAPNFIHKSRSRPDLSSTSTMSDSSLAGSTQSQTLAVPNSGLQRRATTGSATSKPTIQRRRVSRVPQMQLLPSGQWGVVDDDSDEEDTGGWAKVIVTRSRWS
jgi:hypothetical protein